ncbi:MAG TPA: hypothetical protein VJB14_04065 [Planctomycetota bacterium]|nr:hypothetical protein [Planctomycetota bacterium]
MKRDFCIAASLFVLLGVAWGQGAPPQDPKKGFKPNVAVDQAAVDKAIENGLKFLKTSDSPAVQGGDSDELKLLTFIHGGVPESDPAYQALFKKQLEARLEKTYRVALLAMCLEEVDRVKYQYKIAQCGQYLLDNLKPNGGFCYGEPTAYVEDVPSVAPRKDVASSGGTVKGYDAALPEGKVKPVVKNKIKLTKRKDGPAQRSDNSNSQYGALGMRACFDAGITFPKEWVEKAKQYWVANQHPGEKGKGNDRPAVASGGMPLGDPRGWCYSDDQASGCGHGGVPYSSMSAGAIGAVCIYDFMLGKDFKKDKVVLDGLAWLEKNWSVTENVGPAETAKGSPNGWLYYYLYAVERTGMLYDTAFIGNKDWYLEGAKMLLNAQKPDGSWDGSHFKHPTWDTCFAILFLKRATRRLVATEAGGSGIKK